MHWRTRHRFPSKFVLLLFRQSATEIRLNATLSTIHNVSKTDVSATKAQVGTSLP
jgi:hypothetical protein